MKKIIQLIFVAILVFAVFKCAVKKESDEPTPPVVPESQYRNVMVVGTLSSWEPQEPSIVINPNNTNDIMAGSNWDNYYYSTDAGRTWTHGELVSSFGVHADPCLIVDGAGNYYYIHLVPTIDRVVCQKSAGPGSQWSDGTFTGLNGTKDQDKEWAVVDRVNDIIYLGWTEFHEHGSSAPEHTTIILLSKSTDGGLTWSEPVRVSNGTGDATGGRGSVHASMPTVGPDGEVYVSWISPEGIKINKSTDGGTTWLNEDIAVTDFSFQWLYYVPGVQRTPGFPILNCDLSNGAHRGTLYINWTDQRSGLEDTDVWLAKSTDGGMSWSEPRRVNDDPPGKHQFFSWMTVDQATGYVYFVFYDRRHHEDSTTDVYMAMSRDGGETFSNFIVGESSFSPVSSVFLGDYNGISAHNNVVRPIWARMDEDRSLSLWTALVDLTN
ncbi:MAG: exo-alpha-sialidase [bacterium]|nr:exo-alpha-sialidase [bacterium]